jgi:exonuclease VII small subunit
MPTMSDVTRRTYEQRLDKLETIAARLSGELVMAGGLDPVAARRLHHNLEAIETEIELLLEVLEADSKSAA